MSIGYTLPSNISNILKLSSLRVYLSAQNLFTIAQYKGYDPEVNSKASNIHTQGVDIGMIPQVSTYMLGLNVKF